MTFDFTIVIGLGGTLRPHQRRSAAIPVMGVIATLLLPRFMIPAAYLSMRRMRFARRASRSSKPGSIAKQTKRRHEMKRHAVVFAVIASFMAVAPASWAQSGNMGSMDMKDMDMMGKEQKSTAPKQASQAKRHKGVGTVTAVDNANGTVTIAHGPIKTLNWSAMSMTFGVKDRTLLEKLSTGKKVEFEFIQQGPDYIITSAK